MIEYEEIMVDDFYQQMEKVGHYNFNKNNMFTLNWTNVKSALVSAFITAVLGIGGYVIGVGDVFRLDVHTLVNVASLSALTTFVSLLKSFLTTDQGNFVGLTNVHPPE